MAATFTIAATLHPRFGPVHRRQKPAGLNRNHPSTLFSSSSSSSYSLSSSTKTKVSTSTTNSSDVIEESYVVDDDTKSEKFDWYSEWYPVAPVCDLDKRVPHGKKIMGIDVVVWWDRNESEWKVFDDCCPHRLAPLSEGRIDAWGRLQCVYHGWCFSGSGACQLIPQAPTDGPPVHTFKKACVPSYPSVLQHDIVWFWPSTDPRYHDILTKKRPPYIAELDDPSYARSMGNRDIPYGYEILTENLMDPAHVRYAHKGIMRVPDDKNRPKADKEGGRPMDLIVEKLDKTGFSAKQERGFSKFIAPCVFYMSPMPATTEDSAAKQKRLLLVFICIPVSPGNSRLIWAFPRNFGVWIDKIVPRWMFHIGQNLILDSDLYLLHVEERKIKEIGPSNWNKACFVPTKSDGLVVGFRKWINKYSGGEVDWSKKYDGTLPPTPPREVLMDRYWSHVVKCTSCSAGYKGLKITETVLQILSVGLIGIVGVVRQGALTTVQRFALFATALILFAASKWLSNFIYKNFHFHDYNHALL
ncbi:protochlorophyllide-dependent translocon component 52, chloroplastic-like [Silene latifolia]|uniref:protochlorophyllide-dependent translocon component 52, chloroplastic-like n=1 Tax=Silene latifolia TaxID=37657 RepID=UPI003D781D06